MRNNPIRTIAEPLRGPDTPMAVMAKEEGHVLLPMPTQPGGAYSALTAATLLPLAAAGIDPLELDASCMLVTDGCPMCGGKGHYTVQIFRVGGDTPARRPPYYGNA